ncbi:MAG: ThuA domain-containing protein [Pirellulales bacterium]|nr:ThuA domain-containing protein [Pirellulales bacterium]
MRRQLTTLIAISMVFIAAASAIAADAPLKIHMISGSREYKSAESLKILEKYLSGRYNVAITASWARDGAKELDGIEDLPAADLLIVFARRMKLSDEHMAIVRKHWESGKPIVGIRTASHAFSREENKTFDLKVMGGNYQGHFGKEDVAVTNVEAGADHPVLDGVGEIVSGKLYKAGPLAEVAVLLQNGTIKSRKATHAVTWVHEYNGARTFYTSLGVPKDFEDEDFMRMVTNAIFWTTKKDAVKYKRAE